MGRFPGEKIPGVDLFDGKNVARKNGENVDAGKPGWGWVAGQ